jgi:hypothetical protein
MASGCQVREVSTVLSKLTETNKSDPISGSAFLLGFMIGRNTKCIHE